MTRSQPSITRSSQWFQDSLCVFLGLLPCSAPLLCAPLGQSSETMGLRVTTPLCLTEINVSTLPHQVIISMLVFLDSHLTCIHFFLTISLSPQASASQMKRKTKSSCQLTKKKERSSNPLTHTKVKLACS